VLTLADLAREVLIARQGGVDAYGTGLLGLDLEEPLVSDLPADRRVARLREVVRQQ